MSWIIPKHCLHLQLCVILEPMQELMSRHKAYALNPRDCLKTTLFQKWQKMVAPPGKAERQKGKLFILGIFYDTKASTSILIDKESCFLFTFIYVINAWYLQL